MNSDRADSLSFATSSTMSTSHPEVSHLLAGVLNDPAAQSLSVVPTAVLLTPQSTALNSLAAAPTEFHQFKKFPAEIREMIFIASIPDNNNMVEVDTHVRNRCICITTKRKVSVLFYISIEARNFAMKHFKVQLKPDLTAKELAAVKHPFDADRIQTRVSPTETLYFRGTGERMWPFFDIFCSELWSAEAKNTIKTVMLDCGVFRMFGHRGFKHVLKWLVDMKGVKVIKYDYYFSTYALMQWDQKFTNHPNNFDLTFPEDLIRKWRLELGDKLLEFRKDDSLRRAEGRRRAVAYEEANRDLFINSPLAGFAGWSNPSV